MLDSFDCSSFREATHAPRVAVIRLQHLAHVSVVKSVNGIFRQGLVRVICRGSQGRIEIHITPETSWVVAHAVFAWAGRDVVYNLQYGA